jgi:rhamnose transport system substrate-binding protein
MTKPTARRRLATLIAVGALAATVTVAASAASSSARSVATASAGTKLFMLPKFTGIPPFTQADQGAHSLAKQFGYSLSYGGPTTGSATAQVSFINNAVSGGYKGLFISADDPASVTPALVRARKAGVAVVSYDSDVLPAGRSVYIEGTGTPQIALAELNMLGSQIGYSGSFAILSAAATDSNQVLWNKQLKQDLATNAKFKKMKLVAIVNPPDDTAPSATTYTENILKAYPTIKGIIAPTTVAVAAAAQVIQQQHLCSKYVVTGLGDPQQMKTFVTSGCVKQFALWNFTTEGKVAMCAMHAVLTKEVTGKTGQSFTCPGSGSFKIGAGSTVIAGPAEIFTDKNLSAYTF